MVEWAMPDLDELLGRAYRAAHSSDKVSKELLDADFKASMKDGDFSKQAYERFHALNGVPDGRCYISKVQKDFLKKYLEKGQNG